MDNMMSQKEERTLSVHNEHEFLLKLERAGLNEDLAQKVIVSKNNELARGVVKFIQNGGVEPTISQKRAREIMGKNFFGIEEAIRYFGVNPSQRQLAMLSEIPFSEAVLEQCRKTHILVAIFPLSILDIRKKMQNKGLFYNQDWYNEEAFAEEQGQIGWQLIRKTPVDNSTSKKWQEQQKLLGKEDEVPTSRVMIYTIIGHYLVTGERLFEHKYVRTSSLGSVGRRVDVGRFDPDGLDVNDFCWDGRRNSDLGLVSSRKS